MKRSWTKGFTLIEVTLAIVIGIIMIAGATLIYNQAKASAGNSRANAKVASLQSLIEQYMARADGVAPSSVVVRALWERARPDDFNKSPWGGVCSPCSATPYADPAAPGGTAPTRGVINGYAVDTDAGSNVVRPQGTSEGPTSTVLPPTGETWAGVLLYYQYPDANPRFVWDENRRSLLQAKTYTVSTVNQKGERWFFVRGNSAGLSGDDADLGLKGKIQN